MTTRTHMTTTNRIKRAFSGLSLMGFLACSGGGGGGSTPPPPPPKTIADRLDYTNPTSGTYTLVKDATLSTSTHLVLNLMGPVGTQGTGVGFYLSADSSKVTWSKPSGSDAILAHNGAFDLGTTPQFAVAKNSGDQLQVGFYQKGATKPAVTFTASTVLASVALDLKSNVTVGSGGNLIAIPNKAVLNQGSGAPVPIAITPGTVTAN